MLQLGHTHTHTHTCTHTHTYTHTHTHTYTHTHIHRDERHARPGKKPRLDDQEDSILDDDEDLNESNYDEVTHAHTHTHTD